MILVGHNGAGKSTLISYLLGFYNSLSQHPFLDHFSQNIQPLTQTQVGYAPEAALLDTSLNAQDYFTLISKLRNVTNFDIKDELSGVRLDVDIKMPIKHYSKGMKQRLMLALALLGDPQIVILDEPTSGLDPFGQQVIEDLLISLKSKFEFILCTHSLALAFDMDDEIWILKEGKIVEKAKFSSLESLEKRFFMFQPEYLQ